MFPWESNSCMCYFSHFWLDHQVNPDGPFTLYVVFIGIKRLWEGQERAIICINLFQTSHPPSNFFNTHGSWGMDFCGSSNASPSTTNVTVNSLPDWQWFLLPSDDVPYIVVRDSLNWLFTSQAALNASIYWSIRLECAQVTLDTNTLNQLLRTQTA